MTCDESIQFLYDLQMFGATFGLENTRRLADLAGNPQDGLKFIHVAGTNGKGSVCAMLEAVYRAAGFKTGLYSSPHLVQFGERIRINNQLLNEAELMALTGRMKQLLAEGAERGWWPKTNAPATTGQSHPTFFEVVTVMALIHFAEQRCEIVLWETGLGGRLDATNIVTPLASVITNIALEHSAYLGDTIEKIAAEKSGIIKPGIPVITGTKEPDALGVLRATAISQNATLIYEPEPDATRVATDLLPNSYQRKNAQLAMTVAIKLQDQLKFDADIPVRALRGFTFPGRLQQIARGNQTILVDGAHNPASIRALRSSLGGVSLPTIFSCFADKDLQLVLEELLPVASRLLLVPVNSPRSALPMDLRQRAKTLKPGLSVETFESLLEAFRAVENESEVLITGSLYLVGEALRFLSPGQTTGASEQALNDWTASSSK